MSSTILLTVLDKLLGAALSLLGNLLGKKTEHPTRQPPQLLPPRPVNFVDRDAELKQIGDVLRSYQRRAKKARSEWRGVLLCGMAGVGKTDLAIEAAHRLKDRFPDGVVWQFVGQSMADDMLNIIASAFDIQVSGLTLPQKKVAIQKTLTNKRALLIFDNAEQNPSIAEVLDIISTCAFIVTSRTAFMLPGVKRIDLTELPLEGAMEIFTQTIGRALSDVERKAAQEICKRVGRLPLAVVLASSQAEILRLDLNHLLERIDRAMLDALQIESDSDKGVRAAFQSTYAALNVEEWVAFALLGVFSEQGFGLDAVRAVNTNPQAEDYLLHLVALSLVKPLGNGWYALHPLLKHFAQEKLDDPDAYHRMADYYLDLIRRNQQNFDLIELERPNILIALDWSQRVKQQRIAVDLTEALLGPDTYNGFLAKRGYWQEGVGFIQQALVTAKNLGDAALEARFNADLGLFCYWQGKNDAARSYYQEALAKFEALGDTHWVIRVLHRLGYIADDEDDYGRARELYERSLARSEALGQPDLISISRHLVGVVAYHEGDYDEARRRLEQSLQEKLARGDEADVARTRRRLAAVARMQGHHAAQTEKKHYLDEARYLLEEALKVETNQRSRARALRQLGMVAQEEGDLSEALDCFKQSLELFERLGNRKGVSSVKYNLGSVAFARGDHKQAEALCLESLQMAQELRCRYGEALALRLLAQLSLKQGNRVQAEELLNQATRVLEAIHSPHVQEFKKSLDG